MSGNRKPLEGSHAESLALRREVMAACANASLAELDAALEAFPLSELPEIIRKPEHGLVMLRGRIGGDGSAFNVGEAVVTRAAVRLGTGAIGMCYLLGRDARKAEAAATLDALCQSPGNAERMMRVLVEPVRERVANEQAEARRETAATRVNFFTLVRGED